MSSTEEKIIIIVADKLGVDRAEVTPDAVFIDDLGADSLDLVELIMAMEEEFGFEIGDEEAEKLRTVGDVINFVKARS
jgi:acyl carrier protein